MRNISVKCENISLRVETYIHTMNTTEKYGNTFYIEILNTYWSVKMLIIKRGDVYYADLRPVVGSEQGGIRPVVVVQNEAGNRHSSTVIIAAITSQMNKAKLPTHVEMDAKRCHMIKDSVILLEQVRTIDKKRLREKVCHLDDGMIAKVNHALRISLELDT